MPILTHVLDEVRHCTICAEYLPLGARPIFQLHPKARILIAGQAPGCKVHETGIPFSDASGERLRSWLGLEAEVFYNPEIVAILPMGFCYPGTGKNGDFPPRPECTPMWREKLLAHLPNIRLTLVIGQYAQKYYFPELGALSVTEVVRSWQEYWQRELVPLPHPSPRNNIWLRRNIWFEKTVLPPLKSSIATILAEIDKG
jgi:uracil-DNA glycosylase